MQGKVTYILLMSPFINLLTVNYVQKTHNCLWIKINYRNKKAEAVNLYGRFRIPEGWHCCFLQTCNLKLMALRISYIANKITLTLLFDEKYISCIYCCQIRKPCSQLTSTIAFFFAFCCQLQALSMNSIICCHRSHSWSLTQTQLQMSNVNKV